MHARAHTEPCIKLSLLSRHVFMLTLNVLPHPSKTPCKLDCIHCKTLSIHSIQRSNWFNAGLTYSGDDGELSSQRRAEEVDPALVYQFFGGFFLLFASYFIHVGAHAVYVAASVQCITAEHLSAT